MIVIYLCMTHIAFIINNNIYTYHNIIYNNIHVDARFMKFYNNCYQIFLYRYNIYSVLVLAVQYIICVLNIALESSMSVHRYMNRCTAGKNE